MQLGNINYFVPISSRIGKNAQYNLDIKTDDKKAQIKGSLRFPYMIPVPTKCLIKLNIKEVADINEKSRISKELAFCRKNRNKIEMYAQKTYNDITLNKNEKLVKNSCDFKLLEQAYIEYCIENNLEEAKNLQEQLFIERINDIAKWSDEVITKANERSEKINEQKELALK